MCCLSEQKTILDQAKREKRLYEIANALFRTSTSPVVRARLFEYAKRKFALMLELDQQFLNLNHSITIDALNKKG